MPDGFEYFILYIIALVVTAVVVMYTRKGNMSEEDIRQLRNRQDIDYAALRFRQELRNESERVRNESHWRGH
jgi:cell division protein FtsL